MIRRINFTVYLKSRLHLVSFCDQPITAFGVKERKVSVLSLLRFAPRRFLNHISINNSLLDFFKAQLGALSDRIL